MNELLAFGVFVLVLLLILAGILAHALMNIGCDPEDEDWEKDNRHNHHTPQGGRRK